MTVILTDTACDITLNQAIAMDVEVVPMRVSFGDLPYEQLADEHFEQFYQLLESEKSLPVTSQPSPADFLTTFARAKTRGDSVVAILLSGQLSGTVQSAAIAKEMADYDDIHIVDSLQATIGQRLLVDHAVRLRQRGLNGAEIAVILTEMAGRIRLFGALDTLKFLRKGGRIPRSTEVLGTALGIKPIVQLTDGVITMAGKARGHAGAVTTMVRLMEENADFDPATPVYFGYTKAEAAGVKFRKLAAAKFKLKATELHPVGATIGTHVGPGAFAAAYLVK